MADKPDRLDMLKKLSFIGKDNINIFESYIPNYYDEIYTLYTLLDETNINYNNITFLQPICGDHFTFICKMKKNDIIKLYNFLKDDHKIKYLRNKEFNVYVESTDDMTEIIFKRIK